MCNKPVMILRDRSLAAYLTATGSKQHVILSQKCAPGAERPPKAIAPKEDEKA
ncbi:MAG: hypothetical protein KME31_36620 [Tolypothrix carrinoi HA7290-LM1]|jgi:hypothetical protein|nr:hypothetical protein [Tolypothrix carrinoi HA7290-LM1]